MTFSDPTGPSPDLSTISHHFKGTDSKDDWSTNMEFGMCVNSNYWNGSVHEGFMKKSDLIDIEDICFLIKTEEPVRVIVTGHSMGGAISSLIYLKLKFKFHGSDELIESNQSYEIKLPPWTIW